MNNKLGLGDVLASINNQSDLSGSNVVKKIQDKLKDIDQECDDLTSNINYLFRVERTYPSVYRNNGFTLYLDNKVTLLYVATAIGATNLVKALLEVERIDVGACSSGNFTPLQLAAMEGYSGIMKLLINRGSDVNGSSTLFIQEDDPLFLAIKNSNEEAVKVLIASEVDLHKRGLRDEKTFLHYASEIGNEAIILALINANMDPYSKCDHGQTPVDIYISKHPNRHGYLMRLKNAESKGTIAFYVTIGLGTLIAASSLVADVIVFSVVEPDVLAIIAIIATVVVVTLAFIAQYVTRKMCHPSAKVDRNKEAVDNKKITNPVELVSEKKFFIGVKHSIVNQDKKVTLSDIVIKDELKQELKVMCSDISEKMQEKMRRLKYNPPAGYIFYGPPGTGKTLLARAIAGETNRSFISVSGSELVGKYAGQGVYHVLDLFEKARKNAPCIVFIDEIDAIGGKRSDSNSGVSKDHNLTVNQMLTEMDGFKINSDIVVIAATNRIEALDSALLRAGRLSKKIHIPLPDEDLREKILKFYIEDLQVGKEEFDYKDLVAKTSGFSGADISHFVNEVKYHVIHQSEDEDDIKLTMSDFTTVCEKLKNEFRKSENNKASNKMDPYSYNDNQRAKHSIVNQDKKVTLSDIVIKDELKQELKVMCSDISEKMQEKMRRLKYNPPAGYIFYGPPGTGKTLLARAIAGETNRSFISVSGSELVGKYAGQGVYHVLDLFEKARKNAPCIVFIDEIDAIGGKRSDSNSDASKDHNLTVNQMLTEMDGFKINSDIVVIAATNRIEALDSALLRAGRLSKKIHIPLPDEDLREKILKFYIEDLQVGKEEFDYKDLVAKTSGFSGADISHFVNEVKYHVIHQSEDEDDIKLTMSDFTTVCEKLKNEFRKSENNKASNRMGPYSPFCTSSNAPTLLQDTKLDFTCEKRSV